MENDVPVHEWKTCEMYGHLYMDVKGSPDVRECIDCGDQY